MRRLALALGLAVLVSGCSTALTPQQLGPSLSETFTGLYVGQQNRLGRPGLHGSDLGVLASCRRSGTAPDGPGEDWACTVQYADAGASTAQTFEVQVKADGCWKADGPPAVQPPLLVDARSGQAFPNPLAEWDGCLDTSW